MVSEYVISFAKQTGVTLTDVRLVEGRTVGCIDVYLLHMVANIARKESFLAEAVRVYGSSGYFSSTNAETKQSDIYADVNIAEDHDTYNRFECGHGICAAVLFLIPLRQGHKCFIIKTTYKDNVGNTLGSVDKTECLYRWSHLFLIPLMFTNSWDSVENEVFVDLNRNTIIEANKTGIF